MPSFSFKRKKKIQPQPKPQVDMATVLPSFEDFRTSLLMPNLSARFSMLREQDDPHSKLGKANDDSVLFPKRASRLNLFNHTGLTDIAEVDSIRGSIRPPFIYNRMNSLGSADGYATDDDLSQNGGMMARSRPGEGNTLFGGRQKIYKIPTNSTGSSRNVSGSDEVESNPSKTMGGKAIYEDDIAMSAFQKLREREREEDELAKSENHSDRSSKENVRPSSPSMTNYNSNRETASSTTSTPTHPRTSTEATSVASHSVSSLPGTTVGPSQVLQPSKQGSLNSGGLDRSFTKSKRLYGQGLDQHIIEQQSSALNRLESLHRQRATGGIPGQKVLSQSRSASNLNGRFQRSGPLYASNNFRAASPPPSAMPSALAGFDLGLGNDPPTESGRQMDSCFRPHASISRPMSPEYEASPFVSALEPNDLGKATASGAFNKPNMQYDEEQYAQRQFQLQQGRDTPPLKRPSPSTNIIDDNQANGRMRNDSDASNSSVSRNMDNRRDYHAVEHPLTALPESPGVRKSSLEAQIEPTTNGTFLAGSSGSERSYKPESEMDRDLNPDVPQVVPRPRIFLNTTSETSISQETLEMTHPLYRDIENNRQFLDLSEDPASESPSNEDLIEQRHANLRGKLLGTNLGPDSPTLGPTSGLSGLVRAHLRSDSGQSSIYPSPSPRNAKFPEVSPETNVGDPASMQSDSMFQDNSWVSEDWDRESYAETKADIVDIYAEMPVSLSVRARQIRDQATALRNQESYSKVSQALGRDKVHQILGGEAPRVSQDSSNPASWQDQMKAHHARGGSTETQKEREDLANELAERSKRIQDNLKNFVETESRSNSPMPGIRNHENTSVKPVNPFGKLKSKPPRGSLVGKQENPAKAMKMLGLGPGSSIMNGSSRPSQGASYREELEQSMSHPDQGPRRPLQSKSSQQEFRPRPFDSHPQRQREPSESRNRGKASQNPSPPSAVRDRSNSDVSRDRDDRQRRAMLRNEADSVRDRTNGYRLDLSQPRKFSPNSRPSAEGFSTRQIPGERSQSAMSNRLRSNERSAMPGYFDQRGPLPLQPNTASASSFSPRASPVIPYSPQFLSSGHEPFPSISNSTLPTMITPQQSHSPPNRTPPNRKKSISKYDISEPTFMSCTSSVTTVDLPPGASLSNGIDPPTAAPPVPAINPRRRRTVITQNLANALGRNDRVEPPPIPSPATPVVDPYEVRSTFSADEGDPRPRQPRQKLRKIASEGGSMNARARQLAAMAPSPAVPVFSQQPVPASAVMF